MPRSLGDALAGRGYLAASLAWLSVGILAPPASALPLIAEVFYDATGSDNGHTFVELYGVPGTPLAGFVLEGVNGANGSVGPSVLLSGAIGTGGFFVVADSAQFSTLVTEVAPSHAVGTALTLQTSLGFLLTMVTIQLIPVMADARGWRWAFAILALGPVAGIWAIRRLVRARTEGAGSSRGY